MLNHGLECPNCGGDLVEGVCAFCPPELDDDRELGHRYCWRRASPAGASEDLMPIAQGDKVRLRGRVGTVTVWPPALLMWILRTAIGVSFL